MYNICILLPIRKITKIKYFVLNVDINLFSTRKYNNRKMAKLTFYRYSVISRIQGMKYVSDSPKRFFL